MEAHRTLISFLLKKTGCLYEHDGEGKKWESKEELRKGLLAGGVVRVGGGEDKGEGGRDYNYGTV